ncbi:MAG: WYL domain-containing protein [Nitrospira sp.]|jgi:predicted DNA-binding transcriptional regulator YafY|uniref:helix-turn-helix transcriptional regulator n=1 Tax=Nitrospira sp. ND1 TaxID=1658518 RepID=UPI0009BB72ED|nr:WYL domain-containing protein [Nitrospira sp. ND1]MBK7421123.1 transcriptional regulator [Nitrospira sp.]OYT25083.1 MAG: transcriptional regulator [Nitrospira sp. UW-LDO-02]MBK9996696.1 transcriptional regulator [Nitrospira sp.]MBP6199417.1 transcriptional regulator [Nitrospira sp.]MBP6205229.1 transcriptional regulator [Nitrospira sp.]
MADRIKPKMGRRPKAYSQADRFARMLRVLSTRAVSVRDLAQELGISVRQVYRDLDGMQEAGHPLEQSDGDGEKTWHLPLGYKGLPQIAVTPYELMALHGAKSHIGYLKGTPLVENLEALIGKVESALPHKVTNHLARINDVFLPRQAPVRDYSRHGEVLAKLEKALLLQRTVTLHHIRPGYEEPAEHSVDPYRLLFHQFGLYVLGFSHRAQAVRLFAVERIVALDVADQSFDIPSDLKLDMNYERVFGLIEEPAQLVRIRFTAEVSYLIRERRWHPSQQNEAQQDGSIIVTMTIGGMEELAAWVLSWGQQAKVLEPQVLVETVKWQLSCALSRYG